MRIAHIVSTYPPYYGGMGNVVFGLVSKLAELGHDVEVLTPDFYESREIRPESVPSAREHEPELQERIGYARHLKPSIRYGNAARLPEIKTMLDAFDIVHLHYPFFGTAQLVRRWKLKHPEKPLVITYHMDTRAAGWKGLLFKWYGAYWMPRILGAADRLIASSFDYLEHSDARQLFAREPAMWREIPFGVDTDTFAPRPKPAALFARHHLDPNKTTALFVGGMDGAHWFKGVREFLEALLVIKKQYNGSLQAVLVGDGEFRSGFELAAQGFGLSNAVFAGGVSAAELPLYYAMADVLVLPSVSKNEAFGMVLLEAMASGVPVIASDLPGVRMVAEQAGVLVEPGNYEDLAEALMGYIMSDDTARKGWSEKVRRIAVDTYSWLRIAKEHEAMYIELAQR